MSTPNTNLSSLDSRYVVLGLDYLQINGDTTGNMDVSGLVATAIGALPATGGTIELPSGTLKWSTPVVVTKPNVRLVGRGSKRTNVVADAGVGTNEILKFTTSATGARVEQIGFTAAASANYAVIHFQGTDAKVELVAVVGSNGSTGGAQRGIVADSTATNFEAVRCKVTGVTTDSSTYGSGAGISISGSDSTIDRCVVTGCTGSSNATYYNQMGGIFLLGVSGTSGQNIKVLKCDAYSNGVHGIYATGVDNVLIDGGTYHDNGALATASGGIGGPNFGRGITIGSTASINPKIVNTSLYNNQENGLIISGGGTGTEISLVQNAIVSNNQAYNNNLGLFAGGHGLEVNSRGGTITGNVCWNNHNGISISGVYLTVTGNRCYSNVSQDTTQGAGIQLNFAAGTASLLCNAVSGSNQISVSSGGFPGVVIGAMISGTGVGGSVTAVNGNLLTMSTNASVTGPVTITFTGLWTHNVVTGNLCTQNDNFGVHLIGDIQQGNIVSDNILSYNGIAERLGANYDLYATSNVKYMTVRNNLMFSSSIRINLGDYNHNRGGNMTSSDNGRIRSLSYGATVGWNGESSEFGNLSVTDTNAFTMSTPSIAYGGRTVTYNIRNNSGGTMGAITWAAGFSLAGAFTNPASGKARTITFQYNGSSWYEVARAAADI